jgi:hypothetical protein
MRQASIESHRRVAAQRRAETMSDLCMPDELACIHIAEHGGAA